MEKDTATVDPAAANKEVVRRFNKEVIEDGNRVSFDELMDPLFINRTVMPGLDPGPAGMWEVFENMLRTAFPDLKVIIHQQVAEGDWVTTRKTISGTHLGPFTGIPATNLPVAIQVMDMVRIQNGRYIEHYGVNTISVLIAQLRAASTAPISAGTETSAK